MKDRYCLIFILLVLIVEISFSQGTVYVKGKLIEIYTAAPNGPVYPLPVSNGPDDYFDDIIPIEIRGREFATSMPEDGKGPTQVSGDNGRYVIAAVHYKDISIMGWVDLNISFTMKAGSTPRNTYNLFRLDITETGKWYDIPQQKPGANAPTLLFADQGDVKWVDYNQMDGIVIGAKDPSVGLIADPSICILPNGNLIAMCKGTKPKRQFLSTDGGLTWKGFGPDLIQIRFATPFTHNGVLYMLSNFDVGGAPGIFIRKSLDNGETWEKYNGLDYVLLNSTYLNGALNCPSPVIVSQGRIWRAMGDKGPDDFPNLGLMSAPVDADLMNPASWTFTNTIVRLTVTGRYNNRALKPFEPCAVATRDRYPVVISRTRPADAENGDESVIYRSTSAYNLDFTQDDVIDFPGGLDKFCIRYDAVSDKYWAMANVAVSSDYDGTSSIASRRNHLVLESSGDLKKWKVEYVVVHGEDWRFHGYQYPFFVFDGNDIVAAIRTAAENEDGQAVRQHDANFLTFRRIKNFRDFLTIPEIGTLRKGWEHVYVDANSSSEGGTIPLYSTPSGENSEWVQVDLGNGYYAYKKFGTNLVLDGTETQIKLKPFNIDNENQQWKQIRADFRHFFLEKRNTPGYVIDGGITVNRPVLALAALVNSNENQRWEFEPTPSDSMTSPGTSIKYAYESDNDHSFIVYPNPANNAFNIESNCEGVTEVNIFNLDGKLVFNKKYNQSKINIANQEWMKPGIYLIKGVSNSGICNSKKLTICPAIN